jgi:hypothetical protein
MMANRPHPFTLVFDPFRDAAFPAIRTALDGSRTPAAFLLAQPALELMRDLRPDEGLGDGIDDFVALIHAAYLFWCDGEQSVTLPMDATRALCLATDAVPSTVTAPITTRYLQLAPQLIWGQLHPEASFEPLDGWFELEGVGGLRAVACFGVHPHRPGMSVAVVEGSAPALARRPDGSALYQPVMPGADRAGLHAVTSPAELLLLAWRARAI